MTIKFHIDQGEGVTVSPPPPDVELHARLSIGDSGELELRVWRDGVDAQDPWYVLDIRQDGTFSRPGALHAAGGLGLQIDDRGRIKEYAPCE